MRAAMGRDVESCSLAMLDEAGVVISWYGQLGAPGDGNQPFVDRHVSQFYLPEEIATGQPQRDLDSATASGRMTHRGWRRQTDGTTAWSMFVIEAVRLRDGRLQGFSYVTGVCDGGPSTDEAHGGSRAKGFALRVLQVAPALLLALWTSLAVAAAPGALPEHARVSRFGSGWDCMSGFRRVREACERIVVPANAYLEPSGHGWRCDRGFLDVRDQCVAIKVPQNAYLDSSYSKGWRCDRDYRDADDECVAIRIPVNARPNGSAYGSGWICDRGFRLVGTKCVAVVVPAQGFLSDSGDSWECGRGFSKQGAVCAAVHVPGNAHLDYSGNDWACDDGYRKRSSLCEEDL
jgi:hypothetical protein